MRATLVFVVLDRLEQCWHQDSVGGTSVGFLPLNVVGHPNQEFSCAHYEPLWCSVQTQNSRIVGSVGFWTERGAGSCPTLSLVELALKESLLSSIQRYKRPSRYSTMLDVPNQQFCHWLHSVFLALVQYFKT